MASGRVKSTNILILGNPDIDPDFQGWIESHACVEHVSTFEAALEALKEKPFDTIVSRASDFITLRGVHVSEDATALLDGVNIGVGIVDESGSLEWANPKLLSLTDGVRDQVCQRCAETFRWAMAEVRAGTRDIRGRRFTFSSDPESHYEMTATPVIDLPNRVTQVAAVVWDMSDARRLQAKVDAIDRAGRELLSLDAEEIARLNMQDRLELLERKAVRCVKELLNFDNLQIRVLDKANNKLDLVFSHGVPVEGLSHNLSATSEGNGICGYVATVGRSYICPDVANDPRYRTGIENGKSSLTVPLTLQDELVGVANFESVKLASFNEHDRQFAEIFGRYIALALHLLKLLVTERKTTTGQVGSDLLSDMTGPLNDILTEVELLTEDYIGHDDLRHRLRTLSDNVIRIRDSVKSITEGHGGIVREEAASAKRTDPILHGKRILVADDEDIIRETVRDVLTGRGCEVSAAPDGETAIALIAEQTFDLVLSDIKMPRQDGYEVFAATKVKNPKTPVILTTGFGYDPNHAIVRARQNGLAAVLLKPFKVDQLLEEVRKALQST